MFWPNFVTQNYKLYDDANFGGPSEILLQAKREIRLDDRNELIVSSSSTSVFKEIIWPIQAWGGKWKNVLKYVK